MILRGSELLVVRVRTDEGEFLVLPGGGQEHGETLTDTVQREVFEELGLIISAKEVLHTALYHVEKYGKLKLHYVRSTTTCWTPFLTEHSAIRLIRLEELEDFQFTPGDMQFVNWLLQRSKWHT